MRRRQLVELEDLAWFPRAVRDGGTDWLGFMANLTGIFSAIAPKIREALARDRDRRDRRLVLGRRRPLAHARARARRRSGTVQRDVDGSLSERSARSPTRAAPERRPAERAHDTRRRDRRARRSRRRADDVQRVPPLSTRARARDSRGRRAPGAARSSSSRRSTAARSVCWALPLQIPAMLVLDAVRAALPLVAAGCSPISIPLIPLPGAVRRDDVDAADLSARTSSARSSPACPGMRATPGTSAKRPGLGPIHLVGTPKVGSGHES